MKTLYVSFLFLLTFSITNSQDTTVVFTQDSSSEILSDSPVLLDDTFTELTTVNLTGVSFGSAAWGDYDNDGDLDLFLAGRTDANVQVSKLYRNNGNSTFSEQTAISFPKFYFGSADWGDYDNDGDLDLLLSGWVDNVVWGFTAIYRNEGNNTFTEQTSINLLGVLRSSAAWGDYDNDGDLDIVLSGWTGISGHTKIYSNNGNNTFTEQTSISLVSVDFSSVAWGDYDNDGDLDIVLSGRTGTGGTTKIYRNDGNNTFTEQTSVSLPDLIHSKVVWGDYNNDSFLDIIIVGELSTGGYNISKIYKNNRNNSFTEMTSIPLIGIENGSPIWGDYDNDGNLDLLITGETTTGGTITKIYHNNGNDTFSEISTNLINIKFTSAAWGDYDNDGDLDIIMAGNTGTTLVSKIYKNNTINSNTVPTSPTNLSSTTNSTSVTLSWSKSTDNETPQAGLKYNIVVGTTPRAVDIVSPMSDRNTGYRRVVKMGNTNCNNSWTIKGLENGTYFWSVQAIDNSFGGSNFSSEHTFFVGPESTISWMDSIKVVDNGNENINLIYGQSPFGTDSIDVVLGELSLPPVPPTGVFDSRFELPILTPEFSLRDFRDDALTARNWMIKFQPGSGGYPITFTWKPTVLPVGLFFLKDNVTGTIVNVNMKENNSYTLTNAGITSLKIEFTTVPITWDALIQLKDNGNISNNLKFGQSPMATEGIDYALGELPLPPAPPAGVFDARFEIPVVPADYSFIDYRNDTSKATTWLIKFQPGSEGYPFTITWDPLDLPEGYFFLKDNVTGTIVNVNMKENNSYTLNNTGITALKIEYAKQVCLNVNLNQGWNIISVPVTALDMNTQTLFPGYTSPTYAYSNGYQPVTILTNGLGFWIRYASTAVVNICGTIADGSIIPVQAGWNIIGVYDQDITVASITTTPPSIITSPFYGFDNGYVQPTSLQSGKGYWIRASQAGVINLSTVLGKKNTNQILSTKIEPAWSRILITDKEGKQGIVYIAKENINLINFDLPPVPPEGIFDVRYENDRNVEFLNGNKEIRISSARYPITIKPVGMDIRIKDSFTGGVIDRVLVDGESFIIEDNSINKLTIVGVDVPDEYSLHQNYPNPFNPSTTIKFSLPINSNVRITIFNQLGEKVEVLLEKELEAGSHTILWNASNLASGLYFYEMKTEKYTSVKKLLLMK